MMAGKLRHQVTLQQRVDGSPPDLPTGEPDTAWTDFATVYASVGPISGREQFAAQQINADVSVRIRMRYMEGVTPQMRAVFGDRHYEILSVIDFEERHWELTLLCAQGAAYGSGL